VIWLPAESPHFQNFVRSSFPPVQIHNVPCSKDMLVLYIWKTNSKFLAFNRTIHHKCITYFRYKNNSRFCHSNVRTTAHSNLPWIFGYWKQS
jgi:hypothetical protein